MKILRRINHTGRKKIDRSHVEIKLHDHGKGKPPSFSAELELKSLGLPDDADVYVEAYQKETTQRFEFGTVKEPKQPEYSVIDEIDLGGTPLFRIKVVDNKACFGRLLASTEQIAPEDLSGDANREFLIKVSHCELGAIPWELDLQSDAASKPNLRLNWNIPDAINQVRTNPTFQSLLLPAVIREVFSFIFWDCEYSVEDDSWQTQWLDFGVQLTGSERPGEDSTDQREWTDFVVRSFSDQHSLTDRIIETLSGA